MMKKWLVILSSLFFYLLITSISWAHESRPIVIEITEKTRVNAVDTVYYNVNWKIPTSVEQQMLPIFLMPKSCKIYGSDRITLARTYTGKVIYQCQKPLAGQQVTLQYPNVNPSVSTLFRIALVNGEKHQHILKPGETNWSVPMAEDPWVVAKQYTSLGVSHIWQGVDHLLFVACLIFIARSMKRIVITITGFTVAHSITLAVSTLGWFNLPIPPVEAVIALSIVFLAHEIAINDEKSWTNRYPIYVSASFGLLHGFGFAAVLKAIGLPQTELGTALLFFNIGVEIGQLGFIFLLLACYYLITHFKDKFAKTYISVESLRMPVSYFIGTIASYWMLARLLIF